MSNESVDQTIQEMAVALAQGLDPYAVIGKLYVENQLKQQAIALAVQALQALKSVGAPADPVGGFAPAGPGSETPSVESVTPQPKRTRKRR